MRLVRHDYRIAKTSNKKKIDPETEPKKIRFEDIADSNIDALMDYNIRKTRDVNDILILFPDINLAIDMMVSSIISPNDFENVTFNVSNMSNKIPSNILAILNDIMTQELANYYDLTEKLPHMTYEAFATKGAYVEIVVSTTSMFNFFKERHNTIDKNGTTIEALSDVIDRYVGHSSNTRVVKVNDKSISISSDLNLLCIGDAYTDLLAEKKALDKKGKVGLELDVISQLNSYFEAEAIKRDNKGVIQLSYSTPTDLRPHNLVLDPNSVIPLYASGDKRDIYGAFVIIDTETGKPIDTAKYQYIQEEQLKEQEKNDVFTLTSLIVAEAEKGRKKDLEKAPELKISVAERELVRRNIEAIASEFIDPKLLDNDTVKFVQAVSMAEGLLKSGTSIIYIPKEQLFYLAFNYRENGTGKPILEDIYSLASMRALLFYSRVNAQIEGSITKTKVKVEIPSQDNPKVRIPEIDKYILNNIKKKVPWGITNPSLISSWIQRAGLNVEYVHDTLPKYEVDVMESGRELHEPNEDLEKTIKDRITARIGMTPEVVENGMADANFAAGIIAEKGMLAKRVYMKQLVLNRGLNQYARIIGLNDGVVYNRLISAIESNYDEIINSFSDEFKDKLKNIKVDKDGMAKYLVNDYFNYIDITLPKPNVNDEEVKTDHFNNFKDNLSDVVDFFFDDAGISDLLGDKSDDIKKGLLYTKMSEYLNTKGYFNDITEIVNIVKGNDVKINTLDVISNLKKKFEEAIKEHTEHSDAEEENTAPKTSTKKNDGVESNNNNDNNDNW